MTPTQTQEFTLSLRIPAWSARTQMKVNGKAISGHTRLCENSPDLEQRRPGGNHLRHARQTVELNGQVALQRGPVVLSLDNRLTPAASGQITLDRNPELKPNPAAAKKIGAWMAFDVGGLTFCDYASAGNAFSEQNIFRTWLPQPLDMAKVYETGQTWQHAFARADVDESAQAPATGGKPAKRSGAGRERSDGQFGQRVCQ